MVKVLEIRKKEKKCEEYELRQNIDLAIECYKKLLVEERKTDPTNEECRLLGKIGYLFVIKRNFEVAEEYIREAIECANKRGNVILICHQYLKLGNLYQARDKLNMALYYYSKAEDFLISKQVNQSDYEIKKLSLAIMNNKAVIFMLKGDIVKARKYLVDLINLFDKHKDFTDFEKKKFYIPALVNLGNIFYETDDLTSAIYYLEKAEKEIENLQEINVKTQLGVFLNLSYLLILLKDIKKAKKIIRKMRALLPPNDKIFKIHYLINLSKLWREVGEDEISTQLLEKAQFLAEKIDHTYAKGLVFNELGLVYKDKDDLQSSLEYLTKARKFFETSDFYRHKVRNRIEEIESNFIRIAIQWGAKVEDKDPYTLGHSARTTYYAFQIGKIVYQGDELALKGLIIGGFLHDIGKLKIADRILRKAGRLTPEEYQEIRKHPVYAVEQLRNIEFPWGNVKQCILYHHEKFDGSGYPEGLSGLDIPLCARIISVADVFDALTTERPYRAPWSWEKALDYIVSQKNLAFDPDIVDVFVEAINKLDKRLISTQYTEHMVRELWKFFA